MGEGLEEELVGESPEAILCAELLQSCPAL